MPVIHIVSFKVFLAIILSALVTDLLIENGLVIFNMTGNKKPTDGKEAMRPANAKELANTEVPTDAKRLTDIEGLANIEESIVNCYKYQY